MPPPDWLSEWTHDGTSIKQAFLALFSVATPPPPARKQVLDLLNLWERKSQPALPITRPADTIWISTHTYRRLEDLWHLEMLPGIMYAIIMEVRATENTENLRRVLDAIKPHIELLKKSIWGAVILRAMIVNDYFLEEINQNFLHSFFRDLSRTEKYELIQSLCAVPLHKQKVITILIRLKICNDYNEIIAILDSGKVRFFE